MAMDYCCCHGSPSGGMPLFATTAASQIKHTSRKVPALLRSACRHGKRQQSKAGRRSTLKTVDFYICWSTLNIAGRRILSCSNLLYMEVPGFMSDDQVVQ